MARIPRFECNEPLEIMSDKFTKVVIPKIGFWFEAYCGCKMLIGRMGNNHVVANNNQIKDGIKEAVIEGMMEVYMATQSNGADGNGTIPYIINAVLKTEDNEVLARAVEKGQASRSSRFNPSPAY